MVQDPWRVFLTTDHPNGAPFTSYPRLIRLLMDRGFRNDQLAQIHPAAAAMSQLGDLDRVYSLYEIAIMTRAAPARILGLADRGHLGAGARADITVYHDRPNPEQMFQSPMLVFKDGEVVVEEGRVTCPVRRDHPGRPARIRPGIERRIGQWFDRYHATRLANFRISDDEMAEGIGSPISVHPCRPKVGRDHQRHRDRGHLCRGLRHDGHPNRHHRAERPLGAGGRHHHDRLRHLGHRLRRRGRHRVRDSTPQNRPTAGPVSACCCSPSRVMSWRSRWSAGSVNAC